MELTEIHVGGHNWWTLGFEATGPASQLHTELEATVALVFAQALPGGMELGTDHSQSYAQWLTDSDQGTYQYRSGTSRGTGKRHNSSSDGAVELPSGQVRRGW